MFPQSLFLKASPIKILILCLVCKNEPGSVLRRGLHHLPREEHQRKFKNRK